VVPELAPVAALLRCAPEDLALELAGCRAAWRGSRCWRRSCHRRSGSVAHPDRPRERLLADGARALSDADLLSLVLGTGTGGLSGRAAALAVTERLSIAELAWASPTRSRGGPGSVPHAPPRSQRRSTRRARRVGTAAAREGAHSVVFAHNHPSGVMRRSLLWGAATRRPRRVGQRKRVRPHNVRTKVAS
jgi:hypothetical protein